MHVEEFIDHLRKEKRYSQHTLTSYQKDISQFWEHITGTFEAESASEVSHFYIRSWMVQLMDNGVGARSVNRKLSALRTYFKYLMRQGIVKKDPTLKIEPPKTSKRLPVYLEREQTDKLFEIASIGEGFEASRDRAILEILYGTGMRKAELISLKDSDVDFHQRQIKVLGKGNKERLIPISENLVATIKEYIELRDERFTTDVLLVTDKGAPLYPKLVYNIVRKFLNLVTTLDKKSPHVLRHTFATHLSNNGAELNAVKDLLGHSSLAATQVYTHNNIEKLKEVFKKAHPKA